MGLGPYCRCPSRARELARANRPPPSSIAVSPRSTAPGTEALQTLGFDVGEVELGTVAAWVARGLTAHDAAYVALAEAGDVMLISGDDQILEVAASISSPLASVR